MDMIELLKSPEGKLLEFKRDLSSPLNILRTIVAFANTAGGTVVIGVEDKTHYVSGLDDPLLIEEKLANLINDSICPQILPEIEVVPWRDTYLLAVQIFPSTAKPHYLKNKGAAKGTYIRVGSTNRLADEIMSAQLKRTTFDGSYDMQPFLPALSSEAIDFRVASEFFSPVKKLTHSDLETMGLMAEYQGKKVPTIAGVLLFGKNRLKYFPDAWIQLGRFDGITKTRIIDTADIDAYPILAIDNVMDFVKKHALQEINIPGMTQSVSQSGSGPKYASFSGSKSGSKTTSWSRHVKSWSIPVVAIREAVINAIVHADYSQRGSPIRLAIFDDRIEIENPGLLLFGLTLEEIKRGISKLRNRVIGQVFYRLNIIERWGSGIRRIIDSCVESGFPEPLFEEIGTHFRVTIYTQVVGKPSINELDEKVLLLLKSAADVGLSTAELAEKINKSHRATRTRLLALIEKGLVVEVGKNANDPGRKYFSVDKK